MDVQVVFDSTETLEAVDTADAPVCTLDEVRDDTRVIPATEEALFALLDRRPDLLFVADRYQQKTLLKDISPKWAFLPGDGYVVRLRASTLSGGVMVSTAANLDDDYVGLLPPGDYSGIIVEEFVPRPQWEVNGYVDKSSQLGFWNVLNQQWTHDGGYITQYHQEKDESIIDGIQQLARNAVCALNLRSCWWNLEARKKDDKWVVIEVNARLGWDLNPSYTANAFGDQNPWEVWSKL